MSEVMRVVRQEALGPPEVLEVVHQPRPDPGPNEVLVKVHAASLNPTDWKHRAGPGFVRKPPFVLGWDLSGVVVKTGIGVARFQPGDEIFGLLSYPHGHGAHAEYVAAPARWFEAKPSSLSHVEAAALPLVSLTAWQALVENGGLQAGHRVLVHAGAGGVGHVAVQIAKSAGAHVIATASETKLAFVKGLGADEVIDYRTTDFAASLRDVDLVLDTIGGDTARRSLRVLRPGGIVVSILPVGSRNFFEEAEELGVRAVRMLVDSSHAHLAEISRLVEAGLRPSIAATYELEAAAEAHRAGETGRTSGKIVLTMV